MLTWHVANVSFADSEASIVESLNTKDFGAAQNEETEHSNVWFLGKARITVARQNGAWRVWPFFLPR